MGGGSPRRKGAAAPAPGSLERGRMLSPPWGGGGRTPKSSRRPGEGGSPARAPALGARDPKKREAGFGPGTVRAPRAVPEEKATRPPPPTARPGCGMLTSVGSLSGFAGNWEG